ncbi:recombinase family protein [Embleya sp. NPDC005971]|uniref:recombinase family protein n=1 Tax=Embleya sp. NPDC005971 TaxID=3156724 RepID=UPI0033E92692
MHTTTIRGLRAIRLSVLTDETTSVDRQRDADDRAAAALGIDFDGREACDLDVSASKTSPFDRPDLGEWLRKPAEYDAIVFWRFDRAIRSMADMSKLAEWAREHGIMIVFAEGLGGSGPMVFDFRNRVDPVAEPWFVAFAEYRAGREKRRHILDAAQAAQRVLGEVITISEQRWYDSRLLEEIVELANAKATEIGGEYDRELSAERDAYVKGTD